MTEAGRVLLVGDNEVDMLAAAAVLTRLAYAVDTATGAAQALEMVASTSYDAVLVDCRLPPHGGSEVFEVTAELRRREGSGPRTPVIALSTAGAGEADRCRAAGVDDVLAKPVTPETLAAALARRVAGPAGADVAARPAGPGALDPARLAELRDPDPAGYEPPIADLARSFLSQGAAMLQRLADAVRADDAGTAEQEARALKGAAGNLGAVRLADLAADLESMARRGRLEGAREILRGMEDEFGHVRRELAAVVAER